MGRVDQKDTSNLKDLDQAVRYTSVNFESLFNVINGNLEFGQNIKTVIVSNNFDIINTEFRISHSLGKVPTGYLVASSDAATSVYNGDSAWTGSIIYLKASALATVQLMLF